MKKINKTNKRSAFTIVELAIVIIVLLLLLVSLLKAKDVVEITKMTIMNRTANNMYNETVQFEKLYGALPGNLSKSQCDSFSTSFKNWGGASICATAAAVDDGAVAACYDPNSTTSTSCTAASPDLAVTAASGKRNSASLITTGEVVWAMRFLSIVGSIGTVDTQAAQGCLVADWQKCLLSAPKGAWTVFTPKTTVDTRDGSIYFNEFGRGALNHHIDQIAIGVVSNAGGIYPMSSSFAHKFDGKFDDGNPLTGGVIGSRGSNAATTPVCHSVANDIASKTAAGITRSVVYNDDKDLSKGCWLAILPEMIVKG